MVDTIDFAVCDMGQARRWAKVQEFQDPTRQDKGESCQAFSKCVSSTHTGDQPPVFTHGITTTVPAEEAPEMRDCSEFSYMDMRLVEFG